MIEPVALEDFFISFFVSALIILSGACYALLYAWSKLKGPNALRWAAYGAYCILAISVLVLTRISHFTSDWLWLSFIMLAGYYLAPIAIWHLCVKTHHSSNQEDNHER
jgi:hypothetical protein